MLAIAPDRELSLTPNLPLDIVPSRSGQPNLSAHGLGFRGDQMPTTSPSSTAEETEDPEPTAPMLSVVIPCLLSIIGLRRG